MRLTLNPGDTYGRRDDLLFFAVAALSVAAVVTLNGFNTFHDRARVGYPVDPWEPFVWEGSSGLIVLALTPLIMAFTRRAWPLDPPRWRKVCLHALAAVVFSLVHVAAMGSARSAVYAVAGAAYDPLGPLADWLYEFRKDLVVYVAIVALYVLWRGLRSGTGPAEPADAEILEVRDGARRHFVPLADVQWVEAAGNYVELHRSGAPVLHRASLTGMERRLSDAGFVRIHRSFLVALPLVTELRLAGSGYVVRIGSGPETAELPVSRRHTRELKDRLVRATKQAWSQR